MILKYFNILNFEKKNRGMVFPQFNDFVCYFTFLSTFCDIVVSTYLFSHAYLLCALYLGSMDCMECVVNTQID